MQYDFMAFVLDILFQSHDLSTSNGLTTAFAQFLMICISGVVLILKLIIFIVIVLIWRRKTMLVYLFEDLKQKWIFHLIYFAHHIAFRVLIAIILLLSLSLSKLLLVSLLFGIQTISMILNIIPLYKKKLLYF